MTIEGLWSVDFHAKTDSGTGIVIFETGRVFGGDASYTYIGNYNIKNQIIKATVKITPFLKNPTPTVFGDSVPYTLIIEDQLPPILGNSMTLTGCAENNKNQKLVINFLKRAELP